MWKNEPIEFESCHPDGAWFEYLKDLFVESKVYKCYVRSIRIPDFIEYMDKRYFFEIIAQTTLSPSGGDVPPEHCFLIKFHNAGDPDFGDLGNRLIVTWGKHIKGVRTLVDMLLSSQDCTFLRQHFKNTHKLKAKKPFLEHILTYETYVHFKITETGEEFIYNKINKHVVPMVDTLQPKFFEVAKIPVHVVDAMLDIKKINKKVASM